MAAKRRSGMGEKGQGLVEFALVFLLFPALFIVVLGPGVLQIVRIFFPIANGN